MTAGKLFGDFLVDKGLITSDILLQVLVDQMRKSPSIVEVVFDGCMLPQDVQLEILRLQTSRHWDYQQACSHLGYWTRDLMAQISTATEKTRTPLGQLVLARTNIKFTELTKALDEYLSEDLSPKSAGSPAIVSGQPLGASIDGVSGEAPLPKKNIGENLLTELLDVFSEERRKRIDSQIKTLEGLLATNQPESVFLPHLRAIHTEIQGLWGAARFVRLDLVGALLHSLDSTFTKYLKDTRQANQKASQLIGSSKSAMDTIWTLTSYLSGNRTEQGFLDSDENRKLYVHALSSVENLSAEIDSIVEVA